LHCLGQHIALEPDLHAASFGCWTRRIRTWSSRRPTIISTRLGLSRLP
jgi:hypothetical protein